MVKRVLLLASASFVTAFPPLPGDTGYQGDWDPSAEDIQEQDKFLENTSQGAEVDRNIIIGVVTITWVFR